MLCSLHYVWITYVSMYWSCSRWRPLMAPLSGTASLSSSLSSSRCRGIRNGRLPPHSNILLRPKDGRQKHRLWQLAAVCGSVGGGVGPSVCSGRFLELRCLGSLVGSRPSSRSTSSSVRDGRGRGGHRVGHAFVHMVRCRGGHRVFVLWNLRRLLERSISMI
jgi:hypothetical protein